MLWGKRSEPAVAAVVEEPQAAITSGWVATIPVLVLGIEHRADATITMHISRVTAVLIEKGVKGTRTPEDNYILLTVCGRYYITKDVADKMTALLMAYYGDRER